ncbi:MAG: TAXI family TRAP transporter solute-binding subunit [Gammaproteobacteria bacterium]|nr:TAXI family TRAP transporter solute-binding subunit [Gammaproteobacteria bacterium]
MSRIFCPDKRSFNGVALIFSIAILMLAGCGSDEQAEPEAPEQPPQSTIKRGDVETHLFLGTGSVKGVYFPIGGVICRLVNRHQSKHSIRCTVESTSGSVSNLRQLRSGMFDLVVTQSDWQYHAYKGTSTFAKDGPNENLRAVFALEPDPLALLVREESEIQQFDDLRDRIVSFGYSRSLQHRSVDDLLEVKGWDDDSFKEIRRMSDTRQIAEICADNVAAVLLLSSSLTDYLATKPQECRLRMVPISGPEVETVIKQKPYYRRGIIPKGMYLDSQEDVTSFGLGAIFVASESTSPKAIYHVVKEIVENFRDFQSLHPSLQGLDKRELPYAGISAPLHPGAIRYYKEARLLK